MSPKSPVRCQLPITVWHVPMHASACAHRKGASGGWKQGGTSGRRKQLNNVRKSWKDLGEVKAISHSKERKHKHKVREQPHRICMEMSTLVGRCFWNGFVSSSLYVPLLDHRGSPWKWSCSFLLSERRLGKYFISLAVVSFVRKTTFVHNKVLHLFLLLIFLIAICHAHSSTVG